jgi:flagellar biosynthesis/type III secretory pathway M-ring protein FliF/YscJ
VSDDVMKMAKDDPATVANVVKTWMNKDESSGS